MNKRSKTLTHAEHGRRSRLRRELSRRSLCAPLNRERAAIRVEKTDDRMVHRLAVAMGLINPLTGKPTAAPKE